MFKLYLNFKIFYLIIILLFIFIIFTKSHASENSINSDEISIGPNTATVKIKIFSSFTCPHCANFHFNIIPEIKKHYLNSGNVQLIFIDFPLDQAAFNASKILHCSDKKKQIDLMDKIYENQRTWTDASTINEINENLKKIAKNLGISSSQFDKCLLDEKISDKILNGRINGSEKYSINSTPTIVINEKKLEGPITFKNIKKKIEKII